VICRNFAVKCGNPIMSDYQPIYGGVKTDFVNYGWEGSGFWITNNANVFDDNIAANCAFAGVEYNQRFAAKFAHNSPRMPLYRGADHADPNGWITYGPGNGAPPIISCARNESYSCGEGFWTSFCGGLGSVDDFVAWHIREEAIYAARNAWSVFRRPILLNPVDRINESYYETFGFAPPATSYSSGKITVIGPYEIAGFKIGILSSGDRKPYGPDRWPVDEPEVHLYQGGKLHNRVNFLEVNPNEAPKKTILQDIEAYIPEGGRDIAIRLEGVNEFSDVMRKSELYCYNFNGQDFEYFAPYQAADYVPPERIYKGKRMPLQNTKEPGMTNAESLAAGGNV